MTHAIQTNTHSQSADRLDVPTSALFWFVALTLAISWGIIGLYIFLPEFAEGAFGKMEGIHPLYFVATWGPAIAGVLIVLRHGGRRGLKAFLSRLFLWRGMAGWWAFVLLGLPVVYIAGSLIKGGPILAPLPPEGIGAVVLVALVMMFLGPIEEFGWRGVAQPILQRHMAPIWAGALIGLFWGCWHLPAFFLSGTVYADWNFPIFLLGCVTLAVLVTPILNASGGGLLLPMVFHWQLILPIWPDAQPWDTWILVVVCAAILWFKRGMMFRRTDAVTQVIPGSS